MRDYFESDDGTDCREMLDDLMRAMKPHVQKRVSMG